MSNSRDYFLEDFLKESENALDELKELDGLEELLVSESDDFSKTPVAPSPDVLSHLAEKIGVQTDAYVEITISDDEKSVYASFYPPSEGKEPLDLSSIETRLSSVGVTYGIIWDMLQQVVFACNTERIVQNYIQIARGRDPVREIPEHYELEEGLVKPVSVIDEQQQRIDFREVSPFVLVKKGDILARTIPVKPGEPGYTVTGREIPFTRKEIIRWKPGENTLQREGVVVAVCDGRFECSDDAFWVNEVLAVGGDVGYRTGHIDFPGDVMIKGQIQDKFHIKAGGAIFCEKTLDASEVSCGKDLTVIMGIIGRNKGRVRVGGKLRARFIENCYVEAKGSIILDAGVLNSTVFTGDRLELKKKGVIVGGIVYAQNGVFAMQVGTKNGPRTELYCGVDYVTENKLVWIRDKNIELALKLQRLNEKISRNPDDKNLVSMNAKIKEAISRLNEAAMGLVGRLDRNENAEVIVKGYIYPGVYIEICHISYIVDSVMSAVRFRLDKEKGRIIADTIH